jgi:asparaginyl-tRNA synthetase
MYTKVKSIYEDTGSFMDKKVTIGGFVRTLRDNKNIGFIELNDGSCFRGIQIVFDPELDNHDEVTRLGVGAAISVTGVILKSPGGKQDFELKAEKVIIEGTCALDYPLQKKRHSFEYLRTIAHLRARTNTFSAVFRVRSIASFAFHKFFMERGFVYVHTPIITGSDCEGAGEMFRVTTLEPGKIIFSEDFFGKMANLTVSGQLSAETFASAFRDVYTFGPTFRAENSNTTRHAAEFWMLEPEIAFADLNNNMDLAEDMLKYVIKYVLEYAPDEMAFFNNFIEQGLLERLDKVVNSEFDRITYTEAVNILEERGEKFEYPTNWGVALQTEHERFLSEKIFKKPVFVTGYPKEIKSFYMRRNEDGKTVAAMDLLVPGVGEIIGGSQREERLDVLESVINELRLDLSDYWWYLELRKYGTVKHAGFGLGFERLLMYITGMTNIRDVIPFPRTVNSLAF